GTRSLNVAVPPRPVVVTCEDSTKPPRLWTTRTTPSAASCTPSAVVLRLSCVDFSTLWPKPGLPRRAAGLSDLAAGRGTASAGATLPLTITPGAASSARRLGETVG